MIRSASCLWSIVFARVSCGCLLEASFSDLWSHPKAAVLSPMNRRHSLLSSVSYIILNNIDTSSAQNSNRLICV